MGYSTIPNTFQTCFSSTCRVNNDKKETKELNEQFTAVQPEMDAITMGKWKTIIWWLKYKLHGIQP
jgi:deoxycytidylate deaminase